MYNTIEHLISLNEILKNIIELNSESNCFYVKLHLQGKPKWILIDNYFPFDGTEHAFFKPSVEFLWILLIEKAYAKINRSYSNCFRDMASDHFSVLSNAPLKKIDHTYLSPIKVWNYIIKSLKLNFTIFSEFDTYILEHYNKEYFYSYYIIGAFLYKSKKYLKLNIPNLKNQDLLCKITKYFQDPNVPKEIITNKNVIISDDNNKFIFIAEFEHFLKTFYKTFVLLYHENYIYENKKFLVKDKSYFVCKLNLKNDTNMVLSLILKLSKYFTKIKNFEVPISRVILCKANCFSNIENESKFRNSFRDTQKEPTLEFIDSTYGREDKHILELFLGKGVYILFFKVLTEFQISAVVSTYSDNPIEIEEVFSEEEKDILFNIKIKNFILLNSIYESYLKKNIEKEENFDKEFSLKSSLFNQNFGFSVLKISNNSKDKLLCIKLLFEIFGMHLISHENSKNTLRLISNSTNENSKSLTEYINIYPNTSEIIIFEWEKTFNYVDIYIYPKIKIKSMYYFPHYYEDFTKIERKKLMDKIFYCEIPYKNGIYIIFFNDFSNNYKIMAEFKNINNILIDLPKCKGNVVTLEIKRFSNNYILLKVINNEEVKYNVDFHIQRI